MTAAILPICTLLLPCDVDRRIRTCSPQATSKFNEQLPWDSEETAQAASSAASVHHSYSSHCNLYHTRHVITTTNTTIIIIVVVIISFDGRNTHYITSYYIT